MKLLDGNTRFQAALKAVELEPWREVYFTCYGDDQALIPTSYGGDAGAMIESSEEDLLAVAGASGFLPRLQLFGSSSDAVKEAKIQVAHWGVVRAKDQLEDMGKEVDILVIAGRAKALDISGEKAVTSYDRLSEAFKDIATRSAKQNSKCMFGPEFLVWVPAAKTYATLFLCSPTARRETRPLHARLGKAATCKAQLIEGKSFKWHGPVFVPCTTPFDIPPVDEITTEAKKFLSPDDKGPELATTEGGGERAR